MQASACEGISGDRVLFAFVSSTTGEAYYHHDFCLTESFPSCNEKTTTIQALLVAWPGSVSQYRHELSAAKQKASNITDDSIASHD